MANACNYQESAGGQSDCPEKEEKEKRDPIPRKCQERILAQGCARREQRKSAGETSPVFVNHRKWELNLHISDFFCIFAAGKRKTDKWGSQR